MLRTGYSTILDGVLATLPHITLDPWREHAPLILTESRSLAGVLRHTVRDYRSRIAPTNGQCGGFLRTEMAPRLRPDDSVIQDHLGDLRFKQRRFADAAAAWGRSLAGDGESIDRSRIQKKLADAKARMEAR